MSKAKTLDLFAELERIDAEAKAAKEALAAGVEDEITQMVETTIKPTMAKINKMVEAFGYKGSSVAFDIVRKGAMAVIAAKPKGGTRHRSNPAELDAAANAAWAAIQKAGSKGILGLDMPPEVKAVSPSVTKLMERIGKAVKTTGEKRACRYFPA